MATQLTTEQLATLKAAILAETDPAFVEARTQGAVGIMADFYNTLTSPAVKAWASMVEPLTSDEATPWPAFDALTAGRRDSWLRFFAFPRDYSKGPVRKWITDIWGNATAGSNAANILTDAGQRTITRGEAVLGGNAPATTNSVTAIKLAWQGQVTIDDVVAAINLP